LDARSSPVSVLVKPNSRSICGTDALIQPLTAIPIKNNVIMVSNHPAITKFIPYYATKNSQTVKLLAKHCKKNGPFLWFKK